LFFKLGDGKYKTKYGTGFMIKHVKDDKYLMLMAAQMFEQYDENGEKL